MFVYLHSYDLDFYHMTSVLILDPDILKTYLYTNNEVSSSKLSKV